jgi:hypothetical protein
MTQLAQPLDPKTELLLERMRNLADPDVMVLTEEEIVLLQKAFPEWIPARSPDDFVRLTQLKRAVAE